MINTLATQLTQLGLKLHTLRNNATANLFCKSRYRNQQGLTVDQCEYCE